MFLRTALIFGFVCLGCWFTPVPICAQETVALPLILPAGSKSFPADSATRDLPRAPEPNAGEVNSAATPIIHIARQTDSPVRGVIQRPFRAWLTLSLIGQASVLADVKTTIDLRRAYPTTFHEADPLARPFVNLPVAAYTAASVGLTAGLSLLSWKLTHSENIWLRNHWWLPQTAQIVVNAECAAFNAHQ